MYIKRIFVKFNSVAGVSAREKKIINLRNSKWPSKPSSETILYSLYKKIWEKFTYVHILSYIKSICQVYWIYVEKKLRYMYDYLNLYIKYKYDFFFSNWTFWEQYTGIIRKFWKYTPVTCYTLCRVCVLSVMIYEELYLQ